MEYMFREGNHRFRIAVSIINMYAIVISFKFISHIKHRSKSYQNAYT